LSPRRTASASRWGADQVEVGGGDRADRGAVVVVVAGREHVGGVQREVDTAALGALPDGLELGAGGGEDEDRLKQQREVLAAVRVAIASWSATTSRCGSASTGDLRVEVGDAHARISCRSMGS
jgi:hypothetical protein